MHIHVLKRFIQEKPTFSPFPPIEPIPPGGPGAPCQTKNNIADSNLSGVFTQQQNTVLSPVFES